VNRPRLLACLALLLILAAPARAGFDEGMDSFYAEDYGAAVAQFRPLAEAGHALAQHRLAICYNMGFGVAEDPAQAAYWFRRAAEQNVADAAYMLGLLYEYGRGVPFSHYQAVYWWRRAAVLGSYEAMMLLDDDEPRWRHW